MGFWHLKISQSVPAFRRLFQVAPEKYMPHMALRPGERVLEFGCGAGLSSIHFDPKNYIGVDIDERRIEFAKGLNSGYDYRKLDGTCLPFEKEEFDHTLAIGVFHHISDEDIVENLGELSRLLKPNKAIIAVEPYLTQNLVHNFWMQTVDRGRFIRRQEDYLAFFSLYFDVEMLDHFLSPSLFNLATFRLTKKGQHDLP